jgi:hypothetical protein
VAKRCSEKFHGQRQLGSKHPTDTPWSQNLTQRHYRWTHAPFGAFFSSFKEQAIRIQEEHARAAWTLSLLGKEIVRSNAEQIDLIEQLEARYRPRERRPAKIWTINEPEEIDDSEQAEIQENTNNPAEIRKASAAVNQIITKGGRAV